MCLNILTVRMPTLHRLDSLKLQDNRGAGKRAGRWILLPLDRARLAISPCLVFMFKMSNLKLMLYQCQVVESCEQCLVLYVHFKYCVVALWAKCSLMQQNKDFASKKFPQNNDDIWTKRHFCLRMSLCGELWLLLISCLWYSKMFIMSWDLQLLPWQRWVHRKVKLSLS